MDLQKFKVKSVDCLGDSGGNVSCHSEECRPLDVTILVCVAAKFQNTFHCSLVFNRRKISCKKREYKIN